MASKRSSSSSGHSQNSKQPKRQVSVGTFKKWQLQQEKEHSTLSWLRCTEQDKFVDTLWCETCRTFEDKICDRLWENRPIGADIGIEQKPDL